jgi:signal transduction histidine kinase
VSNSIKFIQRGEIKIFAHFNQSANWLEVEIKDTGIGIKNEDLDNIF